MMEFLYTRKIFSQLRKESHGIAKYGSNNSLGCIPEECHRMLLDLKNSTNCSCATTMTNNTVCEEEDDSIVPVVLWSIFGAIFSILFVELILIRFKHPILNNLFGNSVFMMGIFSSMVTQLCTMPYLQDDSDGITLWFNVILGVFSMIFVIFGFHYFFQRSPEENLGSHDRGMGLVVVIITVLLVGLEIVLMVMVFKTKNIPSVFSSYLLVYACEKIVQMLVYIAIRRCKVHEDFKEGAIYYFKFLSFLNFTMWLNSIPFTDIKIYDEVSHTDALEYVDNSFKALVIDYRLLCALLFLEHALAIRSDEEEHPHRQDEEEYAMPSRKRWLYTALGVVIGLVCLALQILNGAQSWNKSINIAVNICPILVDAALVFFALWFWNNIKSSLDSHKPFDLVLFMVVSMGALSIVYLFIFGALSLVSFKQEGDSYVDWSACVFFVRGLSLWVLLLVYAAIPVNSMELRGNHIKLNYVLVSALCVGLFSRFIGSILDEFDGTMHELAHHHLKSNKLTILQELFLIGPLFQLAASLDLSLHFLLMIWRLHEKPKHIVDHEQPNAVAEQAGAVVQPSHNENGETNDGARQPDDDLNVDFVQPNGTQHERRNDPALESSGGEHPFQANEHTPLLSKDT